MKVLGALVTIALLVLGGARVAAAHPAGFTSVNRYIGVQATAEGGLRVAFLLDFAEMPAYAELEQLDADHDGRVSPEEQRAYLESRLPPLVAAWSITVDGARATPRVAGSRLEVLDGERGLSTLRIEAEVVVDRPAAARPPGPALDVHVYDGAFVDHAGWREIAGADSDEATVTAGVKEAPSEALAYGTGTDRPPRVDDAWFTFRFARGAPGAQTASPAPTARPAFAPAAPVDPGLARLSRAMRTDEGWSFTLLALGLALALGAAHALSPGHGKALAAAYLVGARARPAQAAIFGVAVTASHTAVVFLVGLLAVAIERSIGSDRLMRGLEAVAAVTVLALGLVQLTRRWREVSGGDHAHAPPPATTRGTRSLVALGLSAGLTPCPSALALLLAAVALHRYGLGLALVAAFSVGVACTLTAAGLLVVVARRRLERVVPGGPLLRWLPIASSVCVLVIGVLLVAGVWRG
jgi:ABC-type nickel/cobalt efflux system permease component RcnA